MADIAPDLSHLTEEERRVIEEVLQRQKNEEEKDKEVVKNLAAEVKQMEERVQTQKLQPHPFGGLMSDPDKEGLCDICQKVKFADGIGHQCNVCHRHSCARCGTRVPIKNGKFTWTCILCKKKQELLKKTGQWYHGKPEELLSGSSTAGSIGAAPASNKTPNGPQQRFNGSMSARGPGGPGAPGGPPHPGLRRQLSHDPSQYPPSGAGGPPLTQHQRQQSLRRHGTIDPGYGMSQEDEMRRQASMRRRGFEVDTPPGAAPGAGHGPGTPPVTSRTRDPSRSRALPDPRTMQQDFHDERNRTRQMPRRPDSQGASRRGLDDSREQGGARRRTQSYDRFGQLEREYAGEVDARRGPYDNWDARNRTSGQTGAGSSRYANVDERRRAYQQNSFSSSEEEMRSNLSDFTGDDGSIHSYRSEYSTRTHPGLRHPVRSGRAGRLWRMSSQQEPDYYQQEGMYDESRSPANVTWQPSADGHRLIGHMILRKYTNELTRDVSRSMNSATILGLKVEGGKMTASGRMAALVTRVKPGSVADVIGHLRAGDEVLEWNGTPLRNLTFEEVYDIIGESREETEVELMVSRKMSDRDSYGMPGAGVDDPRRYSPRPRGGRRRGGGGPPLEFPAAGGTGQPGVPFVSGRIQLSFYYSHSDARLTVTVIQAAELLPRPDQSYRNAYAKLYLLPNRSEQTKRRTKIISKTNDPQWQQMFHYAPLKESELDDLTLEITVWDYERYSQANNEFVGESLIELASVALNDEPRWFYLTYPDTGVDTRRPPALNYAEPDFNSIASAEGLSPAGSSVSRLSDMDYISDPDMLEAGPRRKQRSSREQREYWDPSRGVGSSRQRYGPSGLLESTRYPEQQSPRSYRDQPYDQDRRSRQPTGGLADSELRSQRSHRRSAHSAPPAGQESYYYDEQEGSPPGSRPASRTSNSARKRQLPILPAANPSASSPRRPSLNAPLPGGGAEHYDAVASHLHSPHPTAPASLSPSSTSRHSQPRSTDPRDAKPIMQLHNATLKVPGDPDDPSVILPSAPPLSPHHHHGHHHHHHSHHHPPKLEQLLKNSSQEENIDPRDRERSGTYGSGVTISSTGSTPLLSSGDVAGRGAGNGNTAMDATLSVPSDQNDPFSNTRHSRSASRRSMRNTSTSLSRSSEPTSKAGESDLALLVPDHHRRKLSDSVSRLQSLDLDDTGSQVGAGEPPALEKSTSASDVFNRKKEFNYDEFESKYLAQMEERNRKGVSSKAAAILGLKKESKRPTFTRSEEVGHQSPASMVKQMSKDSNDGSVSSSGHSYSRSQSHLAEATHLLNFVEGLGPGQLVGRQVLASPCLGELQLTIKYQKGKLDVEVIRGRGLVPRQGTRVLPSTYVKVQLMEDKRIIAKQKTATQPRSLNPPYRQVLSFTDGIEHRILQVSVWGDYGRMEKKVLIGLALINMDDLDLSSIVIGWYKLFDPESLTNTHSRSAYPSNPGVPMSIEERQAQRARHQDVS